MNVDQRHHVLRFRVVGVEGRCRDRDVAEGRATLRCLEDPANAHLEPSPVRYPHGDWRAEGEVVVFRVVGVHEAAVEPEPCRDVLAAFDPVDVDRVVQVRGDSADLGVVVEDARISAADRSDGGDAARARCCSVGLLRERREAVLRRHCIVRCEQLVDGIGERGAKSGSEDRDERDQRQPDHQRRRRRGRPARVPHRVLTGERPRAAADLRSRPSEYRRERPHGPLRIQRDADEQKEDAEPEGEEASRRRQPGREDPVDEEQDAERERDERHDRSKPREARGRQRRTFANGCDRRDACRLHRRSEAGEQGDDDPDGQADDDRSRGDDGSALREVLAERREQRREAPREHEAEQEAEHRCDQADRRRLDHDGPKHLTS